jgi:hypothetical protein
MSSEAPAGAFVDSDPKRAAESERAQAGAGTVMVIDPAPVVSWHGSSFDLLTGLDISDESDSIPGELFDHLFGSTSPNR